MKPGKIFFNCLLGMIAFEAWIIMINGAMWNDSILTLLGFFYFMQTQFRKKGEQKKTTKRILLVILTTIVIVAFFLSGIKNGNITGGVTSSHLPMKSIIVLIGSGIFADGIFSSTKLYVGGKYGFISYSYLIVGSICMILGFAVQNVIPMYSVASVVLLLLVIINGKANNNIFENNNIWSFVLALFFSVCLTMGRWDVIAKETTSFSFRLLLDLSIGIVGWFFAWYPMILFCMEKIYTINWKKKMEKQHFCIIMLFCFFCYMPYFLCFYPGVLSDDSITQMRQVMGITGYSNHHPFLHTGLIQLLYYIGYKAGQVMGVNNAVNLGVACYTLFSMMFMSFTFTCVWHRIKKWNMPKWLLLLTLFFYALFPINAIYVITMWKDVIFAGVVLLFLLNLSDLWEDCARSEKNVVHLIWYVVLSFCVCFFRGNGLYAWLMTAPLTLLVFRKCWKRVLGCMLIVAALAIVYRTEIFSLLEVEKADYIEGLSIPAQQIACVISEGGNLSKEDVSLLSSIVDLEKVKTDYLTYISDPIKNLVRDKGNQEYLVSHKMEYLKAYLRIGVKNPFLYCKAFINQTKGYWFHKVNNWIYYPSGVRENEIGIFRDSLLPENMDRNIEKLLVKTENFYHKFFSIGLITYFLIFCFFASCYDKIGRKNRNRNIVIYLFPIALVVTLVMATPVCAEFRYAYAIFVALPLFSGNMLMNGMLKEGM